VTEEDKVDIWQARVRMALEASLQGVNFKCSFKDSTADDELPYDLQSSLTLNATSDTMMITQQYD
jgi:hypothetical protein